MSNILAWIVIGLVAGVLASLVMGGTGYGIIGDIVIGIIGAFIGGWLFSMLGIATPFGGMGGTIFVAFIGSALLAPPPAIPVLRGDKLLLMTNSKVPRWR